jgi:hypothetical protein
MTTASGAASHNLDAAPDYVRYAYPPQNVAAMLRSAFLLVLLPAC